MSQNSSFRVAKLGFPSRHSDLCFSCHVFHCDLLPSPFIVKDSGDYARPIQIIQDHLDFLWGTIGFNI